MTGDSPTARRSFTIQPITAQVIDAAVALHQQALHYSLNSRLGADHLRYLYLTMQQDADCLALAAVSGETVLGLVSAVLHPGQFTSRLLAGFTLRRLARLFLGLARHPGNWFELLESRALIQPVKYEGKEVESYLTTLAISPEVRRQGVGRALVEAVDDFVRRNGQSSYHLDTRADNDSALTFYLRLGFIELEKRGQDLILVRSL